MVDVGGKSESDRRARARAVVRMSPDTAAIVARGDAPKGDVLGTARIAGIQAAKRTDGADPARAPAPLTYIDVEAEIDPAAGTVTFVGEVTHHGPTGVEMEALTACSVAALTAYDMVKGIERGVVIEEVALLEKTGGKPRLARRGPNVDGMRAAIMTISTSLSEGRGEDESGPALAELGARYRRGGGGDRGGRRRAATRSSGRSAITPTAPDATSC